MKHFSRIAIMALAIAAFGTSTATFAQAGKSKKPVPVDKNKASYVVGWDMASQLPPIVRDEINPEIVAQAMRDALSGKKPKYDKAESKKIREAFVSQLRAKAKVQYEKLAAENKSKGAAFLAANKKKPGVKTTSSGLQYKVLKQGTGAHPGPNDTVKIDYVGTFINGKKFDASADHKGGGPASIPVANVIPGFREGLELMQVGGHYKLYIPSDLAYGEQPQNPFPPNATLIFDVKLDKTTPPAPNSGDSSDNSSDGSGN
ncbi:FKBP-type peptidyl-prolyl cis-trans isomerase [Oleiagrimonas sp.]|jgi:FKBP-type peptidyl-prolyl cis-trans isomerase FkpA|uniref:FKBP-type peptidyl-prolyl cis-trans isomerase N-terminal domain-containing protein n=1 Tax=Oleiagrimonas sp. TaxID=2010330 RepID=UPI0026299C39|nr:FKBP-type peptidyl-prolyl cis-trans isomerase [Oleiagrimonas sp.]MDA3914749.1 FKBP-type peptidyl-prolyl cis-trans isomerase [Oleiagrimonas sp.]